MPKPLLPVTHHLQRYPADCLAACAAMVLDYFGRLVAYDRLIQLMRIDLTVGAPYRHLQLLDALGITVTLRQGAL